jgi:hypothetical protein
VLIEQACFGAPAELLAVKTGKRMRVSPPIIAKFMAELTAAGIVEKTTRTSRASIACPARPNASRRRPTELQNMPLGNVSVRSARSLLPATYC